MKAKFLPNYNIRLAVLLAICFFLIKIPASAQTPHGAGYITYDTTFKYPGGSTPTFTLRITRPANMFVAGHADAQPRPVFIAMPGAGEVGTNPANLSRYGPHYWRNNGWDGGVQLGNGRHYPILITVLTDVANTRPVSIMQLMTHLLNSYRIKRNSVHLTGLSMGGWTWGRFITYAATAGDETAMSMVTSFVALQGVASDNYNGVSWGLQGFGRWAANHGGKFFGLEGVADTRKLWEVRNTMDAQAPGQAYFAYENIGGGGHCCWNEMYDPSRTNWNCVGQMGPNVTSYTTPGQHNTMGTYIGGNIFSWMLRQGDTTLVGGTAPPPPVNQLPNANAGADQTITLPVSSVTVNGSASNDPDGSIASYQWSRVSGPAQFNIVSPTQAQTLINNLVQGVYRFELRVTDNNGGIDRDTVQITVNEGVQANLPPIANAGSDQTITLPLALVTVNGSGSSDPDGTIVSYQWRKIGGPNTFNILSIANVITVINSLIAGEYSFELTVTDNLGATDRDTVRITVNPLIPTPNPPTGGGQPRVMMGPGEYVGGAIDANGLAYQWGTTDPPGEVGRAYRLNVTPSDLKFKYVRGSLNGVAFIDVNGNAWIAGYNGNGEHGVGDSITRSAPSRIQVDSAGNPFQNIASITGYHFRATNPTEDITGWYGIKEDGTLWVWGNVQYGYRGNGTLRSHNAPRPVQIVIPGNRKVKQVAAAIVVIVLCTDGTVWTFGNSSAANLGRPITGNDYARPVQLTGLSNITQVAGGRLWNYALAADGTLYSWGYWGEYQGRTSGVPIPTPTPAPNITNALPAPIQKIVTSMLATHVVLTDGSLWSWGGSSMGTVGDGTYIDAITGADLFARGVAMRYLPVRIAPNVRFKDVESNGCYTAYCMAIDEEDQVYFWGRFKGGISGMGAKFATTPMGATYGNDFDQPWPTPINPFATVTQPTIWAVQARACIANPGATNCIAPPANTPPRANAGPTQNINTRIAQLNGTASTDATKILAYRWSQISGPSAAVINLPASPTPKAYFSTDGTFVFKLVVEDGGRAKDSATVQINVNVAAPPPNQLPVANAGPDQTITLPTNIVTVSGASSTDADGTITTYQWSYVSGPTQFTMVTANQAQTIINNLAQGVYRFQLTVTDNLGGIDRDTVQITVNAGAPPPNVPPVASGGNNQSITLPDNSVTVNGSNSSDVDGTITAYQWSRIAGPTQFTIVSPTQAQTVINNLVQGTYRFELRVTDNDGAVDRDTIQVTVNAAPLPANQPPVAVGGNNQSITLPNNSVTVNGSGSSDEDGTITAYQWSRVSGPAQFNIVSPTQAQTDINNLVQGTYRFELRVTDDDGAIDRDTIQVIVNAAPLPVNQPPVAVGGNNQSIILPDNSVTVNGNGSSDADGTITAYQWSRVSGPAQFNIVSPTQVQTEINNLVQGVYRFELRVTDNGGATDRDTIQITVNAAPPPANLPPVASTGNNRVITLPVNNLNVTGIGSSDPDGTIVAYRWSYVAGPNQYNIASPNTAFTNISNLVEGVYRFELMVTDNDGATGRDTLQVTVNATPPVGNLPPVAVGGGNQSTTLPDNSVSVDGSGSTDADGTIVSYVWSRVAGPTQFNIVSPNQAQTDINNLVQGTYRFELRVTDNDGAVDRDTIQVVVNAAPPPENIPPVASAGNNRVITLPTNNLNVTGIGSSDPDGTIVSYSWSYLSGPAQYNIASPNTAFTNINNLVQGVYRFELAVTDNDGAIGRDTLQVTVNAAPVPANLPPVASAGNNRVITLPTNTLNVTGIGSSDPDGTIVAYQWAYISGPAQYNIASPNTAFTAINNLVEGVYRFRLTVTDDDGATGSDTLQVTVNAAPPPANLPPVASAGPNRVVTLPVNSVTVSGNGSSDPDGFITTYRWVRVSGPTQFNIGSPNTSQTAITNLAQGVYRFELTVTDNDGAESRDTMQVTVNAAPVVPNQLPVANAGTNLVMTLPTNSGTLNGNASSDPDGVLVAFQWTKIAGPTQFNIVAPTQIQTTVNNLVQGTYQFELRVTDNQGGIDRDTVLVIVNPAAAPNNQPPRANAGNDVTMTLPVNSTSLSGIASTDPDGVIASYQWTKIAGPAQFNIATPSQGQTLVSNLVQGVYRFELRVTDNLGAIGRDTVQVTVNSNNPNEIPVANAGSDQTITLPESSTNLDGSASFDPDGTVLTYQWSFITGPTQPVIGTPNLAQTSVSGLAEGQYYFELIVRDSRNASSRDTVMVEVLPKNSRAEVFPNPARDYIDVRIVANTERNKTPIIIYDSRGVVVYREDVDRTQRVFVHRIYFKQDMKKGVYLIRVAVDINNVDTIKFLKD